MKYFLLISLAFLSLTSFADKPDSCISHKKIFLNRTLHKVGPCSIGRVQMFAGTDLYESASDLTIHYKKKSLVTIEDTCSSQILFSEVLDETETETKTFRGLNTYRLTKREVQNDTMKVQHTCEAFRSSI